MKKNSSEVILGKKGGSLYGTIRSTQVFENCVSFDRCILCCWCLSTYDYLAFWMGVAHGGPIALSADDNRDLCDSRCILDHCGQKSPRSSQPHLVRCLVQHCAWRDHGNPITRLPGTSRTSLRRCASTAHRSCSVRVANSEGEKANNKITTVEKPAHSG